MAPSRISKRIWTQFFRAGLSCSTKFFSARATDDDAGLETARRVAARYPQIPAQFLSTGGQPDYINDKVISHGADGVGGTLTTSSSSATATCGSRPITSAPWPCPLPMNAWARSPVLIAAWRREGGLWARLEAVGMSVEMTVGRAGGAR